MRAFPTPLAHFPSLAVRVRELRRLLLAGAGRARVREQAASVRREHRRRMAQALKGLQAVKPLCAPELRPLWQDTIDSAVLLLHLNARDFRGALEGLRGRRRGAAARA
jgi:hypothetical protein